MQKIEIYIINKVNNFVNTLFIQKMWKIVKNKLTVGLRNIYQNGIILLQENIQKIKLTIKFNQKFLRKTQSNIIKAIIKLEISTPLKYRYRGFVLRYRVRYLP